ncbi:MAG: archease [Planctomycetaceae bacterium]|nr:archease [Planctomycetaceae bacterium]
MSKHCETFEHTADVGLKASADTLGELFEALAEGLADFICRREQVKTKETITIEARGDDIEALAVEFLWKIMDTIQTNRKAVAAVRVMKIEPNLVHAQVDCEPLNPARHETGTEVKAVTYHMLEVREVEGRWAGQVLLDI